MEDTDRLSWGGGKPGHVSALLSGIVLWNHCEPEGDSQNDVDVNNMMAFLWNFSENSGVVKALAKCSAQISTGKWEVTQASLDMESKPRS